MLVWLIHIIQQHLLLLLVTGLWDLIKCIEKIIKLSLFHLDSVVMAVLMPYGEGSLRITPWLKVIGIPDDVKCCHMGALLRVTWPKSRRARGGGWGNLGTGIIGF